MYTPIKNDLSDLASGQKSRQVPYTAIKMDTASFIPNEYRPTGVIFQDPRNMHLDNIRKVLKHCYSLQAESDPGSAFRFSLFIGPKRRRMMAEYVETSNTDPSEAEKTRPKQRKKGKQREDALQGLLRMDESADPPTSDRNRNHNPNTNARVAGPSNHQSRNIQEIPAVSDQNALVRIDMGQMLRLREMGYEILGPVNGPNEGFPEYEVPKAWVDMLKSHSAPSPTEAQAAIGAGGADPVPHPIIDPALLGQAEQTGHNNTMAAATADMVPEASEQSHQPPTTPILQSAGRNARPTTPPNDNTRSDKNGKQIPKTSKKRLGKRARGNLSPQVIPQTRGNNKKKKVTDDNLAAIEAQNMVQSGSRRQRKATKRK